MLRSIIVSLAVVVAVAATFAVGAEELNERQLRKLEKQASKALDSGDLDGAQRLYNEIFAGTAEPHPARGPGYYVRALSALNGDSSTALELPAIRRDLETYVAASPADPRRHEAVAMLRFLDMIESSQSATQVATDQLNSLQGQLAAEAELVQTAGEENQDLESATEKLRRQLAATRSELAAAREDLEQKEAALDKMKALVVGGGSGF